jgi:hypothetical protein
MPKDDGNVRETRMNVMNAVPKARFDLRHVESLESPIICLDI